MTIIVAFGIFIIADAIIAADRAARVECAEIAENLGVHPALNIYDGGPAWYKHGKDIAAEIRATIEPEADHAE